MKHYFTFLIICLALVSGGEWAQAAKHKKVFVNSKMHIIPKEDDMKMYALLTYLDDHIQAKVYNSHGLLLFNLNLKDITPDTCIYDGIQEEYYFNELRDVYRYENNQVVEHTFYRNGEKIFHQPLFVGDTIWYLDNFIVLPQEARSYGIVKSIDSKTKVVNLHRYSLKDNSLLEEGNFRLIDVKKSIRQGKQFYYRNGKKYRLAVYSQQGQLIEDIAIDTLGKVTKQTSYPVVQDYASTNKPPLWKEQKYFYPDGKLWAKRVRVDDQIEEQYFLPNGEPTEVLDLNEESNLDEIYITIANMPKFPGGTQALIEYLKNNVRYPVVAQEMRITGVVKLSFVVDIDGSISDVIVLEPVHKLLNNEAVRVVKKMPNWIPGTKDGRPVRVRYTMPVSFRLE